MSQFNSYYTSLAELIDKTIVNLSNISADMMAFSKENAKEEEISEIEALDLNEQCNDDGILDDDNSNEISEKDKENKSSIKIDNKEEDIRKIPLPLPIINFVEKSTQTAKQRKSAQISDQDDLAAKKLITNTVPLEQLQTEGPDGQKQPSNVFYKFVVHAEDVTQKYDESIRALITSAVGKSDNPFDDSTIKKIKEKCKYNYLTKSEILEYLKDMYK